MTRKASGYLTKDGTFFATKPQADLFEAMTDFNKALEASLEKPELPNMLKEFIMDKVRAFVLTNKATVARYVELVPESEAPIIEQYDIRVAPATAPVVEQESEPDDEIRTDFVSAFGDTMGEDEPGGTEEGVDEEVRLDGFPTEDIHQ